MSTPRLHDGIRLVSTESAINCAGLFVVSTLMKWGVRSILRDAVLEVEDLVTAAVKATGIPQERVYWTELTRIEYITVQLYGFDEGIRIEVWDSAPNPPTLPNTDPPIKRGWYSTPGGKVVWAELPLVPRHRNPLPAPPPEQFAQDSDTLHRVREGLEGL